MDPILSLDELRTRLDWELSPQEEGMALGALDDASNLVRAYGLPWTDDNAPATVKSIVAQATIRYLRNPDGYILSRAGDETVEWGQGASIGSVHLTEAEQRIIRNLTRPAGLYSAPIYAFSSKAAKRKAEGLVPVAGSTHQFPYYVRDKDPWW